MAIQVHKFRVEGISPLLMNNPSGMRGGGEPKTVEKKQIPTFEEEAAASRYRDDDGTLYLPSIAFRKALLRGCIGKKLGKIGAGTAAAAGVFNVEPRTPLLNIKTGKVLADTEYKVLPARVVIQRNGVIKARAEVHNWAADVVFEIDDDFITATQVKELLNIAGRMAGVGDWRPEKKGSHGRFRVV